MCLVQCAALVTAPREQLWLNSIIMALQLWPVDLLNQSGKPFYNDQDTIDPSLHISFAIAILSISIMWSHSGGMVFQHSWWSFPDVLSTCWLFCLVQFKLSLSQVTMDTRPSDITLFCGQITFTKPGGVYNLERELHQEKRLNETVCPNIWLLLALTIYYLIFIESLSAHLAAVDVAHAIFSGY